MTMPLSLRGLLVVVAAVLFFVSSAQAQDDASVSERGVAARYDAGATGAPTASGEPYNPERLTLSHPTLPFGTLVQLTNVTNGQRVTARVNDRSPASALLQVQLSARAADRLGLGARGGEVVLKLGADELALLERRAAREKERQVRAPAAPSAPVVAATGMRYTVQLASFSDEARAIVAADAIRGAWVQPVTVDGSVVYRVCYGVFNSPERAESGRAFLLARGREGFVKSLDTPPARTAESPVRSTSVDD